LHLVTEGFVLEESVGKLCNATCHFCHAPIKTVAGGILSEICLIKAYSKALSGVCLS